MPDPSAASAADDLTGPDVEVDLLPRPPATRQLLTRLAGRALPRRPGRGGAARPDEVPARRVVVVDEQQDRDRLAGYLRVCGFPLRDQVPPTWLHVLTFPLQLHLMSAPDFPYPALGMVHVANDMSWRRPVTADERLTLTCWAEGPRPHRKGVTVDLCGTAGAGDEVAWQGRSTYLVRGARMPGDDGSRSRPAGDGPEDGDDPALPDPAGTVGLLPRSRWRLPADLGRRYAAVAGDVNPIHLSSLTARLLGFRRAIAHGMWTHARVLADLGPVAQADSGRVRVAFRAPLLLPGTAEVVARPDGSALAVTSRTGERVHLVGALEADFTNRARGV